MNATPASPVPRLDAAAIDTMLRRLAKADSAPWLHGEVARRMAEKLALIKLTPQHVIDWWGFLGGGVRALTERYPQATRSIVEPTSELLARSQAQAKLPWWSPRRWQGAAASVQLDAQPLEPGAAQLLWANMMLHWSGDVPALLANWHRSLAVDGFVMFSCFGPDTLKELRALYQRLGWPVPAPAFTDMHDIGDAMVQAGFADPVMDMEQLTLTFATPAALLQELRGLGANVRRDRPAGLRTPRWRRTLEAELQSLAGPDGRLRVSFEIIYGHAFKPAPRAKLAERTSISLDQMRQMVRQPRSE